MLNLYTISTKSESNENTLSDGEMTSVYYHNLFDYPLNLAELIKWKAGKSITSIKSSTSTTSKNGYFYLEGHEGLIYKRLLRQRISLRKMEIANRTAKVLSLIPTIKMIAVTGSLAMQNSSDESDIDLMIVTKNGSLWTTRLLAYWVIGLFGIQRRRPTDHVQKDRLCLNMWLDESDLVWEQKDRNLYTAHEIAQIVPLVNKNKTYEKFLLKNKWILSFWPSAVKIVNCKLKINKSTPSLLERFCYRIQFQYMKNKISREVVTPTRALFHPQDWGKVVLKRLNI